MVNIKIDNKFMNEIKRKSIRLLPKKGEKWIEQTNMKNGAN